MKSSFRVTRRFFLKRTAWSVAGRFTGPRLMTVGAQDGKLNCAVIGCGSRAMNLLEWLVTQSKETAAGFDYGARLTEFALPGNLAVRAGVKRKVEWDGPNMRVVNLPEANGWIKSRARRGWTV